ncbi:MAG: uroporphyrinogen-III synthase [Candidatus Methanomethylophilaceae archaeon]|nr:uroporphyrinogen-III synthase [Candidatus Methanomethylophilaceae archaeon]
MTRIGFTRPVERLRDSVKEAEEMGFDVIAAPSMRITPGDRAEFDRARDLIVSGNASYAVFGSVTAVEECIKAYGEDFVPLFSKVRIVSIGPSTGAALMSAGIRTDALPEEFSSSGIVDLLKDSVRGKTVLLVRSDSGSDVLYNGLSDAGAETVSIATYKLEEFGMNSALLHLITAIKGGKIDVMAFTSPMSAKIFYSQMQAQAGVPATVEMMGGLKVAAIGKPTSEALRSLGREPDIVPKESTFRDLLEAIAS